MKEASKRISFPRELDRYPFVVLASGSKKRRDFAAEHYARTVLAVNAEVVSGMPESMGITPEEAAVEKVERVLLARTKEQRPPSIIIGADTITTVMKGSRAVELHTLKREGVLTPQELQRATDEAVWLFCSSVIQYITRCGFALITSGHSHFGSLEFVIEGELDKLPTQEVVELMKSPSVPTMATRIPLTEIANTRGGIFRARITNADNKEVVVPISGEQALRTIVYGGLSQALINVLAQKNQAKKAAPHQIPTVRLFDPDIIAE